jgi:hypothetical protein
LRDEGQFVTCCERATPEEIEETPEAFDCETCELRLKRLDLDDHDRVALELYGYLQLPVVQDLRLMPFVFDVLGLAMCRDDALLLLEKLEAIHREQPRQAPEMPDLFGGKLLRKD